MQLLSGYTKPVESLALTPDGSRLFTVASGHSLVWEWDTAAGEVVKKLRFPAPGHAETLTVSSRGDYLIGVGYYGLAVWPLGDPRRKGRAISESCTTSGCAVVGHPTRALIACSYVKSGAGCGYQLINLEDDTATVRRSGHAAVVVGLAFSPEGGQLATASRDGNVKVWNLDSETSHTTMTPRVAPSHVTFRPTGQRIAVAGARSVFIYDLRDGDLLRELHGHGGNVKGLAYSPDGKYLASVSLDGLVILRDAETHEIVGQRDLEMGRLWSMAWQADSSRLVIGGDKLVAVAGVDELLVVQKKKPRGEPLSLAGHTGGVSGLAYSPDGRYLASSAGFQVRMWDLSGGAGQAKPREGFEQPNCWSGTTQELSWSPDGERLVLTAGSLGQIINARTGAVIRQIKLEHANCVHLSSTPSGKLLLLSRNNQNYRQLRLAILDAKTDQELHGTTPEDRYAYRGVAAISADERHVYFGSDAKTVSRWALGGPTTRVFSQSAAIIKLAVSRDERTLVTIGGNNALVWSLPDGARRLELKHPLSCTGIALVGNNRLLTSSYDGLIRLWDLTGGAELFAWDLGMGRIYSVAASPDGMTFAAGVHKKNRIVLMDIPD